jgi:serine-type D-Ala-D-Ala carboxypeptidase/endopeptidase (penicillin-binding protein 4)
VRAAAPRGGLTPGFKLFLRALLVSIVGIGSANAVVLSQAFGTTDEAPDDRRDVLSPTPVIAARRVPDLLVEIPGAASLQARVVELFTNERMGAASAASCAVIRQAGRTLVSEGIDRSVIPASTMKLLTGTAVLQKFGPAHQFETKLLATAAPANGVLTGNLHLVGGGDPLLATEDYLRIFARQPQMATSFEELANAVAAAGITRITGDLVGDERLFDSVRTVDTWKPSYVANGEIGPISALALNDGFTTLKDGERIARPGGSETGALGDAEAADGAAPTTKARQRLVWRRSNDPAANAAAMLSKLLAERGVVVEGTARSVTAADNVAPTVAVVTVKSKPVSEIVGQMLSESDNNTAEVLVKQLGVLPNGPGTWPGGIAAMKVELSKAGISTTELLINDGSGLDRGNRVTCRALMAAIEQSNEAMRTLLPVSGESGTLARRMLGDEVKGRVRAKTGTLNGVSALVGDVTTTGNVRLEFVMVLNELPPGATGVATGDQLAISMSNYPRLTPGLVPGPPTSLEQAPTTLLSADGVAPTTDGSGAPADEPATATTPSTTPIRSNRGTRLPVALDVARLRPPTSVSAFRPTSDSTLPGSTVPTSTVPSSTQPGASRP